MLTRGFSRPVIIQFKNVSFRQILSLSYILKNTSLLKIEFIRRKFSENAPHFEETLLFLKELNLIAVSQEEIKVQSQFRSFLSKLDTSRVREDVLKRLVINLLLKQETTFSESISEFLSGFELINGQYVSTPKTAQRLKHSELRNFFLEIGFIYKDRNLPKYFISKNYFGILANFTKTRRVSKKEFLKILLNRDKIGSLAELCVLRYEKNRLAHFPDLVQKIEHVSLKNVSAGYDIKSFEVIANKKCGSVLKLIEVKAVSSPGYQFYWSRNEMEAAKTFHEIYFLYLLPIENSKMLITTKNSPFDLKNMLIVKNPYSKIYKNHKEWYRITEVLKFSLKSINK